MNAPKKEHLHIVRLLGYLLDLSKWFSIFFMRVKINRGLCSPFDKVRFVDVTCWIDEGIIQNCLSWIRMSNTRVKKKRDHSILTFYTGGRVQSEVFLSSDFVRIKWMTFWMLECRFSSSNESDRVLWPPSPHNLAKQLEILHGQIWNIVKFPMRMSKYLCVRVRPRESYRNFSIFE